MKLLSVRYFLYFIALLLPTQAYCLDFSLFGDVVYSSVSGAEEEEEESFHLGQFDLIADQEIGESTFVTAEVVFEDSGHGFEVDVERFSVSRHITETTTIGVGRFHTQLGIWNHNFHHGSLIQDTISRPFFLEFEDAHGGILPNHLIGVQMLGDHQTWSYALGLGNSNGINTVESVTHPGDSAIEVINTNDPSNEKTMGARFALKPESSWLSEIGLSYMRNNVTELGEEDIGAGEQPFIEHGEILFDQDILALDVRYSGEKLRVLFELFLMSFDDNLDIVDPSVTVSPNADSYDATAYYFQFAYQLSQKLSAVFRMESLDFDDNSTYFQLLNLTPEERSVIAINYKLQESNALRFEYSHTSPDEEKSYSSLSVQWFFLLI